MKLTYQHWPVVAGGPLVSPETGDIFFSKEGGMEETRHVFLAGNGLPGRFAHRPIFTIGETGFGTGLNFLCAWQAFEQHAAPDAMLHYLSIEKSPLAPDMIRHAIAPWPMLVPYVEKLCANYPLPMQGIHRLVLGRVQLTLVWGEAAEWLPQLSAQCNAWFLDGFAPKLNPDLWVEDVFAQIARLSAPDATLATYTAASHVRRGLEAVGFAMEKSPGFGRKREMLHGKRSGTARSTPPRIAVVGAGIAGACVAHQLAAHGCDVQVLEAQAPASGASGNPAGVLYPRVAKDWGLETQFYIGAYQLMLQQLAAWKHAGLAFEWDQTGMLVLPRNARDEARFPAIAASSPPELLRLMPAAEASEEAGVTITQDGLFFPQGCSVSPRELCTALLQHPRITLHCPAAVSALETMGDRWRVITQNAATEFDHVILCAAHETQALVPQFNLPLAWNRGQITLTNMQHTPSMILCQQGYAIPRAGSRMLVGATYDYEHAGRDVREDDHATNLAAWEGVLAEKPDAVREGRASLRCTTPDRMPIIGKLEEGLWVSTAHGSRGLLSAPLAAAMLAHEILGVPSPVSEKVIQRVSAERYR